MMMVDVIEEDLSEFCEPFGDVVEVRLMRYMETNEGKGFAFVSFRSKYDAQKAIEELHNKDFKGTGFRCSLFEYIYKLFIGNVPKTWTDDEFRKLIEEIGLGSEVSLRAYKGGIGGVGYGMPYIFAYIMINLHGKLGFRVLPRLLLCHGDFRFGEQFIIYIGLQNYATCTVCGSYTANQGKKAL
ncbi:putative RNA recognition motif domain, nucleotide-binding alpha-beta plait domain superfamily [Helianthus anomalus]